MNARAAALALLLVLPACDRVIWHEGQPGERGPQGAPGAPAWGVAPHTALERLSRYRAHLEGRGGRDMTSEPLFALLSALGLTLTPPGS